MKVGVTGASGFLGRAILAGARKRKWEIIAFSRNPDAPLLHADEVRPLNNPKEADLAGLDALIHLAGEPLMGLWTEKKRDRILESRVNLTQDLVANLGRLPEKARPKALVSASAVGIYGDRGDDLMDDESDIGFGFLANLCRQWESATMGAEQWGIRSICPRLGLVLGRDGGLVQKLEILFRMRLGARLGSGKQWMSWIHVHDAARVFLFCIEHSLVHGPVNCVAPHSATNAEFTQVFARMNHRRAPLVVPRFLLRALPRGMGEMFLFSQKVDPAIMKAYGFTWEYETLEAALQEVFSEPGENQGGQG